MTTPPTASPPAPGFPDLAMFARGATRRAVLRGLLRTALLVVVLFVLFSLLGKVVGFAAFKLTGRDDAFERVGVVGLFVAHPTLTRGNQSFGTETFGWLHTTKTDRYRQPDGSYVQTEVRMDLLGRISVKSPLGNTLDEALYEGRASNTQARAFVRGLPASAVADVVVDFTRPLDNNSLTTLMREPHIAKLALGAISFYEDPFAGPRRAFQRDGGTSRFFDNAPDRSVAWSGSNYPYNNFAAWTRALKKSDDANLARLGLPDSSALKKLGTASLVHGMYLKDVPADQLALLLDNPLVHSLTPVDVRLTILNRDQSH